MSFASNSCSNEAGTMFRIEPNLINNHCFSPDKVNEICEQARHYLVEKMFETHSLDMNNSVLASPEDL
jgi:hypothetical protein